MNKEDFKILVNSYGSDILRWPEALRDQAAPMFAKHKELVADAAELDALLDAYRVEDVSSKLLERIMVAAEEKTALRASILMFCKKELGIRHPAAIAASLALFGFVTGFSLSTDMGAKTTKLPYYSSILNVEPRML